MKQYVDMITGWLRRSQTRLIVATNSTGAALVIFGILNWTPEELAAVVLAVNSWLAVAAGQSVDTRALQELNDAS